MRWAQPACDLQLAVVATLCSVSSGAAGTEQTAGCGMSQGGGSCAPAAQVVGLRPQPICSCVLCAVCCVLRSVVVLVSWCACCGPLAPQHQQGRHTPTHVLGHSPANNTTRQQQCCSCSLVVRSAPSDPEDLATEQATLCCSTCVVLHRHYISLIYVLQSLI